MSIQCPTCARANPSNAAYCYYDGRGLTAAALTGPLGQGTLPFPMPFSFSDGHGCGNYNQLVLACDRRWSEARGYLVNGTWRSFFGAIGRTDLAALAKLSANQTDADVGLCHLLEKLPADAEALRPAKLALASTVEDLGALEPGKDYKFQVVIANQGMLLLRGSIVADCDWLAFGDHQGNTSTKLFQTRDTYTLSVRVVSSKLRAGKQPLEGQIVIDTNGGRETVAVRAAVPVRPFPSGRAGSDVLAGAASPRELAVKAKAHSREAAVLFERGAVKAWYESNGWTYPVRGAQAKGKSALQQFFEALGLTKPPRLEINTERIVCQGEAGKRLTKKVIVHTTESKLVHAEAHSNQDWIKVLPATSQGTGVTLPLRIEVPPRPGETLEAIVTILGNGQQRFVVPVALTVEAQTAEGTASRSLWLTWTLAGGVVLLGLVIALWVVINHPATGPVKPPSGQTAEQPEQPAPKVETWWDGIAGTNLTASVAELKKTAGETNRPIFERIEGTAAAYRHQGYEQLAAKLAELARKPERREALGRFVAECCVYEPSELNITPLLRGLAQQFPTEGSPFPRGDNGEGVERASFWLRVVCDAIAHKAVPADRSRSLASELANVFGPALDSSVPRKEFQDRAEKALAQRCYHNLLPTAEQSIEQVLAIHEVLIAKFARQLAPAFREQQDLKLLQALEHLDPSALSAVKIAQRWTTENSRVRQELVKMLESRLPMLQPEQMKTLLPLLSHKHTEIVLVGLNVVQARKEGASDVAAEVADLLQHKAPKVREAALNALLAMGAAVETALPKLSQRLLDHWGGEKDPNVEQALTNLLSSQLARLKPEKMREQLLPLLRHKDTKVVLLGLKVVQIREEDASNVAAEVADLLQHKAPRVREAALNSLSAMGAAVEKALPRLCQQLLDHWGAEKEPSVRQALANLLVSRLSTLKREQMKQLLPLLSHKDPEIVLVGLRTVQACKEEAADAAAEVVDLLKHDSAKVREEALNALKALRSAAGKTRGNLSQLLLDHWDTEKDFAVRQALIDLLLSRFALLKKEQMTELLPLLRHKDVEIVQMGLKVVLARKAEAADMAAEVADLLKNGDARVQGTALAALKALGPAARKALPKLFEILEKKPKYQRTSLALEFVGIVDAKDPKSAEPLVLFLLEGLHPEALKIRGAVAETAISRALLTIGQPAVDGIFKVYDPDSRGLDEINYRMNLCNALAKLGPSCRSPANYDSARVLLNNEKRKKYKSNIEAAEKAYKAMAP